MKSKKFLAVIGMVLMALAIVLTGCSTGAANETEDTSAVTQQALGSGTLLLKVNPEIAIDYDENGKVTAVRGVNDDGKEVLVDYDGFVGKDSSVVLEELIALIGEAGYFVEEVEGESRQIVIELEDGSNVPDDKFLNNMALSAQNAVDKFNDSSNLSVNGTDFISADDAKEIAFNHAGVDGTKARFDDQEFDVDDGVPSYELEFTVDGVEYEYDIDAKTGDILKSEKDDRNDDSKYGNNTNNSQSNRTDDSVYEEINDDSAYDNNDDTNYDDSAYNTTTTTQAPRRQQQTTTSAAPKRQQQTSAAPKKQTQPARRDDDDSDYDDNSDYDDSDYDDTDYDDDSDYDDSEYDD